MTPSEIRILFRYNAWANARILDQAARLTREQLLASGNASWGSVRDTLVHTLAAQWIHLERWNGRSPRASLPPAEFPDVTAIRSRWDALECETQAFVAGLTQARLDTVVEYTNLKGERWAYPLWQQMIHQVNHSTQHRSEVAMALTRFGCSPGDLDLLYCIDVGGAA